MDSKSTRKAERKTTTSTLKNSTFSSDPSVFGNSLVRGMTSTPKKSNFSSKLSTSGDSFVLQKVPKYRMKKDSILDMICKAIEAVGVPKRGASYVAIRKWILSNRENKEPGRLRFDMKRSIATGLETGILKRPTVSKSADGLKGYFLVNPRHSSKDKSKAKFKFVSQSKQNRKQPQSDLETRMTKSERKRSLINFPNVRKLIKSRKKSETTSTKNFRYAKGKSKTSKSRKVDRSFTNLNTAAESADLETEAALHETAHLILQEASKVLVVVSKLLEVSNILAQKKASKQKVGSINSDKEVLCVESTNSTQTGELRCEPTESPQTVEPPCEQTHSSQTGGRRVESALSLRTFEKPRVDKYLSLSEAVETILEEDLEDENFGVQRNIPESLVFYSGVEIEVARLLQTIRSNI